MHIQRLKGVARDGIEPPTPVYPKNCRTGEDFQYSVIADI